MKSRQTTDSCGRDGVWCDFSMFRVVQNVTGVWTPSMWPTCILQVRISVHKRVSQAQATIHQRKENLNRKLDWVVRNCHVGIHHSIADWDYSKILIFAGDLEVSKSASGSLFCVSLDERSTPEDTKNTWMCKKQTSVSHSSTESDVISSNCRSTLLISGIRWWTYLLSSSIQPRARGNLLHYKHCDNILPKKHEETVSTVWHVGRSWLDKWWLSHIKRKTFSLRCHASKFLKTMKR